MPVGVLDPALDAREVLAGLADGRALPMDLVLPFAQADAKPLHVLRGGADRCLSFIHHN
ncbi:MAG TPA: hypothetical protein VHV52_12515 [Gaiellaceae bacterium]|nr:hypothetical protein [Gaiellaceae bacterium]